VRRRYTGGRPRPRSTTVSMTDTSDKARDAGAAVRRTATITGMRQIGMLNFDLLVEFDLTVFPDGTPPYPATTQQRVSQLQMGLLRTGQTLPASADPSNPAAIWLDLRNLGWHPGG
jgi:hypothetical protein